MKKPNKIDKLLAKQPRKNQEKPQIIKFKTKVGKKK